jgi:hypothetical protein
MIGWVMMGWDVMGWLEARLVLLAIITTRFAPLQSDNVRRMTTVSIRWI